MYNRYVRNDGGVYRPMQPPPHSGTDCSESHAGHSAPPNNPCSSPSDGKRNPLSAILDKFRLSEMDTGDLLLLILLFLLLREGEDDELLIALGLLLLF